MLPGSSSPTPPLLDVRGLGVLSGSTSLVEDVTFRLHPGERVALLGASGSGKSLTAAAILGTLDPRLRSTGTVTSAGRVAGVFQDSSAALHPLVRLDRQLVQPLLASRSGGARLGRGEARGRVAALAESLGIDDASRRLRGYPSELSGGQRQRLCIALALLCDSSVLVADEPTTALDVVSQASVLDALRTYSDVSRGALLLITHDLAVAAEVCDRALVVVDGRIVEDAPMATLLAEPVAPFTRAMVSAVRGIAA